MLGAMDEISTMEEDNRRSPRTRGRVSELAAVAARQHGCFTDEQADAAGHTRRARQRRLTDGTWVRLGPTTLRAATSPLTWKMRLRAGLLDLGPGAHVAMHSAAALYGTEGFPERSVDLLVLREHRGRSIDGVVHSTGDLPQIDKFTFEGFPVTSAARTIIDLARCVTRPELERLVDHAVRSGLVSPDFLRKRLEHLRGPGRVGVGVLDDVLVDTGGHSFLERAFLKLIREAGLPAPRCQVILRRDGRHVARVDFSFDPLPVVVEVMGRRGHASESERDRDAQRQAEIAALGRILVPFTSNHVFREPAWVVDRLRAVLDGSAQSLQSGICT